MNIIMKKKAKNHILNIKTDTTVQYTSEKASAQYESQLQRAIIKGIKNEAYTYAKESLGEKKPLEVINSEIVPALDEVGRCFENKRIMLWVLERCWKR